MAAASTSTCWIIATGTATKAEKEKVGKGLLGGAKVDSLAGDFESRKVTKLKELEARVNHLCALGNGVVRLDIPDGDRQLKVGSFDNLMKLTDDLAKWDSQVETALRRLERQYLEVEEEENPTFTVLSQYMRKDHIKYIRQFQWDDAKFPRSRGITENANLIMAAVSKLDEEARSQGAKYNDLKSQRGGSEKKESGAGFAARDLVDVLVPDVVENGDFLYTEHLTTVVVVVPKGGEEEFLNHYEHLAEKILPMSAKQLNVGCDKEGATLWRVIVFKKAGSLDAVEAFKKACRDRKFVCRDFDYSADAYANKMEQNEQLQFDSEDQLQIVKDFCKAAWSDTMVAWMHMKVMRVFVESALRFGIAPPVYSAFLLQPEAARVPEVRKALADLLRYSEFDAKEVAAAEAEGEEFQPYVCLTFSPLSGGAKA